MARPTEDHAGSGIDKPAPKTLMEKVGDGLKAVLPKKAPDTVQTDSGNGTEQRQPSVHEPETARQERVQGGQPALNSSNDPNLQ